MQKAIIPIWFIVLGGVCLVPILPVFLGYCAFDETRCAIRRAKIRRRIERRRLPQSQPLLLSPELSARNTVSPRKSTSFLDLPLEIRQQIYRLVLRGPAIVQVGPVRPSWGPRPDTWSLAQHIRAEADPPSADLRRIITHFGTPGANPQARRSGHDFVLIRGSPEQQRQEQFRREISDIIRRREGYTPQAPFTNLMRAHHVVYGDVLDLLYSHNTVSLFGAEMAHYFLRNASPEGLARVRYVHLVLLVSSDNWERTEGVAAVAGTVNAVREALPALRQLDVEIALAWGQPKNPEKFWAWLRGHDVLAQLGGLERFVLKLMVYVREEKKASGQFDRGVKGKKRVRWEPLHSWNQEEYKALKAQVIAPEAFSRDDELAPWAYSGELLVGV
ncbi:hypothetical protein F4810DRAFT_712884 [Camillea tinctor]|nr:hypothetical protein F4810DRAFT_712884 [Camillea tinctor]